MNAFSNCNNLETVKISGEWAKIEEGAFSCNGNLKNVEILGNIDELHGNTFSNCDLLSHLDFGGDIGEHVKEIWIFYFTSGSSLGDIPYIMSDVDGFSVYILEQLNNEQKTLLIDKGIICK